MLVLVLFYLIPAYASNRADRKNRADAELMRAAHKRCQNSTHFQSCLTISTRLAARDVDSGSLHSSPLSSFVSATVAVFADASNHRSECFLDDSPHFR